MERLICEDIDIKVKRWLKAFLLHPVTTIAMETDGISGDAPQILDDLRTDEVGLAGVGEQAQRLDVGGCETTFGNCREHFFNLLITSILIII